MVIKDKQEYIETGLEHLSDRDTYELQEDQTKQVAEELTQAVRAMLQEGHIDKPTAAFVCFFDNNILSFLRAICDPLSENPAHCAFYENGDKTGNRYTNV